MISLISLAITVAFVHRIARQVPRGLSPRYFTVAFNVGEPFRWELVTLVVIFLLGHWIEMRSVRRASGVLDELADLMPVTAERISDSGATEAVPVDDHSEADPMLVRPVMNLPADGVVEEGRIVDEAMITGESKPVGRTPVDVTMSLGGRQ